MSQVPEVRTSPRWSVKRVTPLMGFCPAPMARLPVESAMVCVGPPLFVSPDGLRPALPTNEAPPLVTLPFGTLPNRLW